MKVDDRLLCKTCGKKLPCREHTIRIDATKDPPRIRIPRAVRAAMTTQQINELLKFVGRRIMKRGNGATS